jgi:hypothetical protein
MMRRIRRIDWAPSGGRRLISGRHSWTGEGGAPSRLHRYIKATRRFRPKREGPARRPAQETNSIILVSSRGELRDRRREIILTPTAE